MPTQRPSASAPRRRENERTTAGPTSLCPYSWPKTGAVRAEAASMVRTVRGWIASKVEENSLTLASGRRGSPASSSHSMKELGWASRMPGRSRANSSATCPGSEWASTRIGKPRNSEIASAVISREWTKETWMAMVSRPGTTGRSTSACGR